MKISYFGKKRVEKEIEEAVGTLCFILPDSHGGYFSLSSNGSTSKFHGMYTAFPLKNGWELYRFIEDIKLIDNKIDNPKQKELSSSPTELRHHLNFIERISRKTKEKFYFFGNVLVYEIENYNGDIELLVDARKIYDFSDAGRIYTFKENKEVTLITYKKYADIELSKLDYEHCMAINAKETSAKKTTKISPIGEWLYKEYPADRERNSAYQYYVYRALTFAVQGGAKILFSSANNEVQAIAQLKEAEKKSLKKINFLDWQIKEDPEIETALECCHQALKNLVASIAHHKGLYAGLPWFFQFWTRDEAISCRALSLVGNSVLAKKRLLEHMGNITEDGYISNIYPTNFSQLKSADCAGWVFHRLYDMLPDLTNKEKQHLRILLEKSIANLEKLHVQNSLLYSKPLETWMDTEWSGDVREGARIEIQALFLGMYELAKELNKNQAAEKKYSEKIKKLVEIVRSNFWHPPVLYDGINDTTIRPNIFLAYYIYPRLLSADEWEQCFEHALSKLWLDWGGIATISKEHPLFCDNYTGENNQSYHRGDSWFWINNLAAICLYRLNRKKYSEYIKKIFEASTKEILWKGAIGCHAELSSARELESHGCLLQAWSCAMYVELVYELSELLFL